MPARRARLYDAFAILTVIVIIVLDQWTKSLVVKNLTLGDEVPFPVLGHFLALRYTQNSGAAFSMFSGNALLAVFIVIAIGVVAYLYYKVLNTGPLIYKLVFGMIIGGAIGNLLDRAFRGGAVVDFVSFRIPEIKYYFAIFNVADACISLGVLLLFVLVLFSGFGRTPAPSSEHDASDNTPQQSSSN